MLRAVLKDMTVFELLTLYEKHLENAHTVNKEFLTACLVAIEDEIGDRSLEAVAEGIEHHEKTRNPSREIYGTSEAH
jgi:hypothetical protein